MRWILNLLVTAFVLWGISEILPEEVQVGGFWSLLVVALVLSVVTFLIQLACLGIMAAGAAFGNAFWVIAGVILACLAGYFALGLTSEWLDGFSITSFRAKIAVVIASNLLALRSSDD